jgi:hypothetical protein
VHGVLVALGQEAVHDDRDVTARFQHLIVIQ